VTKIKEEKRYNLNFNLSALTYKERKAKYGNRVRVLSYVYQNNLRAIHLAI
jgi:hypothetical protein